VGVDLLSPASTRTALATLAVGLLGGLAVRLLAPSGAPERAGPVAPPMDGAVPPAPRAPVTPPGDMGLPGADVVPPPGGGAPEVAPAPVAAPAPPPPSTATDWLDRHLQAAGGVWSDTAASLAGAGEPALVARAAEAAALGEGVPPPAGQAPPLTAVSRYLGQELSLARRLTDLGYEDAALKAHIEAIALPRP
jgi:hypothetical protein